MSYIQLSTPIDIFSNSTYTIKRTLDTWTTGVGETVGRALEKHDNIQYYDILPYTFNDLTILSSGYQAYANDLTFPYEEELLRLPFIDIVFLE